MVCDVISDIPPRAGQQKAGKVRNRGTVPSNEGFRLNDAMLIPNKGLFGLNDAFFIANNENFGPSNEYFGRSNASFR